MIEIISKTKTGSEIATLAEAVLFFRSEDSGGSENALIESLITGAREEIENQTNLSLVASTVVIYAEDWSGFLPFSPVATITTTVEYTGQSMPYISVTDGIEITYTTLAKGGMDLKNAVLELAYDWYKRGEPSSYMPENVKRVIKNRRLKGFI